MNGKKKTSGKNKKSRKPKTTRKAKAKPKARPKAKVKPRDVSFAVGEVAAAPDDPIGACQYYDNSGQLNCIDNITKSECAKYKNSIFLVGETCE